MTPLEGLIKAATDDAVRVSTLLRKLKVVAARLGTLQLEEWVDHELNGYAQDDDLPDYRAERGSEVRGNLSGPFGTSATNAPIPPSLFPEDLMQLFRIDFRQPIAEVERLADATDALAANWSADMIGYTNRLIQAGTLVIYRGMYLTDAHHVVTPAAMGAIVDVVRTRILDLALSLEAVEPRAGEPDAQTGDLARVEQIVMNVFGGNVAVASTQVRQQAIVVGVGNRQELMATLRTLGIDPTDAEDLERALDADEAAGDGAPGKAIGTRVRAWAGAVALKGGTAAAKGAAGAAGGLMLKALGQYYGVGE